MTRREHAGGEKSFICQVWNEVHIQIQLRSSFFTGQMTDSPRSWGQGPGSRRDGTSQTPPGPELGLEDALGRAGTWAQALPSAGAVSHLVPSPSRSLRALPAPHGTCQSQSSRLQPWGTPRPTVPQLPGHMNVHPERKSMGQESSPKPKAPMSLPSAPHPPAWGRPEPVQTRVHPKAPICSVGPGEWNVRPRVQRVPERWPGLGRPFSAPHGPEVPARFSPHRFPRHSCDPAPDKGQGQTRKEHLPGQKCGVNVLCRAPHISEGRKHAWDGRLGVTGRRALQGEETTAPRILTSFHLPRSMSDKHPSTWMRRARPHPPKDCARARRDWMAPLLACTGPERRAVERSTRSLSEERSPRTSQAPPQQPQARLPVLAFLPMTPRSGPAPSSCWPGPAHDTDPSAPRPCTQRSPLLRASLPRAQPGTQQALNNCCEASENT